MFVAMRSLGTLAVLAGLSTVALAADVARMEWGSFIVVDDTSNGWSDTKSLSSDDGRSFILTFEALEAKPDANVSEATSRIAGRYEFVQPSFDHFSSYHVTVAGHVIKSATATARLTVIVGSAQEVIEWPTGQAASETFSRELEFALPPDGKLPSPFNVTIEVHANKAMPTDEAYLSVNTVTVTAGTSKLASR